MGRIRCEYLLEDRLIMMEGETRGKNRGRLPREYCNWVREGLWTVIISDKTTKLAGRFVGISQEWSGLNGWRGLCYPRVGQERLESLICVVLRLWLRN